MALMMAIMIIRKIIDCNCIELIENIEHLETALFFGLLSKQPITRVVFWLYEVHFLPALSWQARWIEVPP